MQIPPSPVTFLLGIAIGSVAVWWQGESVAVLAAMAGGYGYRAWQETAHFRRCVAWGARLIDRLAGVR